MDINFVVAGMAAFVTVVGFSLVQFVVAALMVIPMLLWVPEGRSGHVGLNTYGKSIALAAALGIMRAPVRDYVTVAVHVRRYDALYCTVVKFVI